MRLEINLLHGHSRVDLEVVRTSLVACLRCGEDDCDWKCQAPAYVSPHDSKLPMGERLWQAFRRDEKLKEARS